MRANLALVALTASFATRAEAGPYNSGWSNGGFFAQLYAIARHATPTPGGQRVAAAVAYSAADPFNNINLEHRPSCQLQPYPRSTVPILILGNACDFIVCSSAQADFWRAKVAIEPGYVVEPWVADLEQKIGDPNVRRLILSSSGRVESSCALPKLCPPSEWARNHGRWPNGIDDQTGVDFEPEMLDFLKAHPLEDPLVRAGP